MLRVTCNYKKTLFLEFQLVSRQRPCQRRGAAEPKEEAAAEVEVVAEVGEEEVEVAVVRVDEVAADGITTQLTVRHFLTAFLRRLMRSGKLTILTDPAVNIL